MKVSKRFLQKIIQEEINNVSIPRNGDREQQLVQVLIRYRSELIDNNFEQPDSVAVLRRLKAEIKEIMPGMNMIQAIKSLKDKIDPQLYTFFLDAINRGSNAGLKPDKFPQTPVTGRDPDPGFMRVPKKDVAYDQEDVRKNRKS